MWSIMRKTLGGALQRLTQPEHTVIVLRTGSAAAKPRARGRRRELGLSRVRVRQLQRRAEDTLRAKTPANLALAAGG